MCYRSDKAGNYRFVPAGGGVRAPLLHAKMIYLGGLRQYKRTFRSAVVIQLHAPCLLFLNPFPKLRCRPSPGITGSTCSALKK